MLPLFIQTIADDDDREFMENLYNKYYHLMYKITLEIDPKNPEDIIQDTFVKLIPLIDKLREMDERALASYMVLTARSTALDWIRRQKAVQKNFYQGDTEALLADIEDNNSDPSPIFFTKMEYEQLAKLMNQLASKERDLLMLKYFMGMDDMEIAPLLGIKKDSVRKMLERTRKKLLKIIQKSQIFPFS